MSEPHRIHSMGGYWNAWAHSRNNENNVVWRRTWDLGWKIFEPKRADKRWSTMLAGPEGAIYVPLTLVHGLPSDEGRSRTVRMNRLLEAEPGTPGWNYFLNEQAARDYLPRFRVRGPKLAVSRVWVPRVAYPHLKASAPGVALCRSIILPVHFWEERQLGVDLLPKR